jgi:hypothetical protein
MKLSECFNPDHQGLYQKYRLFLASFFFDFEVSDENLAQVIQQEIPELEGWEIGCILKFILAARERERKFIDLSNGIVKPVPNKREILERIHKEKEEGLSD